ncbi:MAG: CDP-diacylglycerol--serine O-phosphatidyltransferase [Ignavibacteriales bacterium]|nr:CDP-diacylglycerol--serine O-phosphatidyltransferase [Ignavibacteriales bacterium]
MTTPRPRMERPKKALPSLFTSANLAGGFISIVFASQGEILLAGWIVVGAAICDALDGVVARALGVSSKFGMELDSLADNVSFGAAPAYLIYAATLHRFEALGMTVGAMYALLAAYRLARFNAELSGFEKKEFSGLPSPISAMTVVFFVIGFYENGRIAEIAEPYAAPLVVALAILMISRVTYDTMPSFSPKGIKKKPLVPALIVLGLIGAYLYGMLAVFAVFLFITLFGIFQALASAIRGGRTETPAEARDLNGSNE